MICNFLSFISRKNGRNKQYQADVGCWKLEILVISLLEIFSLQKEKSWVYYSLSYVQLLCDDYY